MVGSVTPGGRALPLLSVVALALLPLGQIAIAVGLAGAALAVAVVGAGAGVRHRRWVAVRVAALALLVAGFGLVGLPFGLWPAVGALWLASHRWPQMRPDDGWFPPGHSSPGAWVLLVATVLGAAVALWLWLLSDPELGEATLELVELARRTPAAGVVAFIVLFVLVNPVVEEVAYRLVVFEAARAAVPAAGAVVLQAVAFGTLHVTGFPAGALGMALAFVYGLALGALRLLTGGLRLPVIAHIAGNVTIAALVIDEIGGRRQIWGTSW
jgi:uncharacterized protein